MNTNQHNRMSGLPEHANRMRRHNDALRRDGNPPHRFASDFANANVRDIARDARAAKWECVKTFLFIAFAIVSLGCAALALLMYFSEMTALR